MSHFGFAICDLRLTRSRYIGPTWNLPDAAVESTYADQSIYDKNLTPVTYVIGDVAGVVGSPVYAIQQMNKALKRLDARELLQGRARREGGGPDAP